MVTQFNFFFLRHLVIRLSFAIFTCTLLAVELPRAATTRGWVGAYVWGGVITQSSGVQRFYDTIHAMLAAGFDTIRIAPGPSAIDGGILTGRCQGASDRLACYTQILFASDVWDDPGLKRIMLTAIDRTCVTAASSNNACLTESLLVPRKAAIKAEYIAMLSILRDRFAGRPIQFILSNWEGDNFVYCGAYNFGRNAGGKSATDCRAHWLAGQTNVQRVQAHLLWHSYRDEAVAEFVAANPGFDLIHAPEINSLTLLDPGCGGLCNPATDDIVDQIAASGGRAYCSYSSYDTQGPPGGSYLAAIKGLLKICRNVIIGEAGYDIRRPGNLRRNIEVYQALDELRRLPGVIGVIPWNAVNPANGSQRFGLFDTTGADQLFQYLGPIQPNPIIKPSHR